MGRFYDRLQAKWDEGKFVCVGLDPDANKIGHRIGSDYGFSYPGDRAATVRYLTEIIDATHDRVCAYKPNWAFFLRYGGHGLGMLDEVVQHIAQHYPDVLIILDAKVADIGNTNLGYVQYTFGYLGVDAITVHSYMGHVAMEPFLQESDRGVIVLVRTSNEGAGELQDLRVDIGLARAAELDVLNWDRQPAGSDAMNYPALPVYDVLSRNIRSDWNYNGNCAVVVGATAPKELARVRALVGDDIPILIPGVGAQGGSLELAVQNGKNSRGDGIVINASRSVLYATPEDGQSFAEASRAEVRRMNTAIRQVLFVPPTGNDT